MLWCGVCVFFFFQAEDGIRDYDVTGVQTCALPILIDGVRYGFTGHADGSLMAGLVVMAVVNALLWGLCTWMFASGYKLKA